MKSIVKKVLFWFFSVVICGLMVGILGNRAYYEYFEKTNLAYTHETFRMAYRDNQLRKDLKITINGKNVSELYITTITLVNNGNGTLMRPDFAAESDPLRIEGSNIESVFVDKINTSVNSRIVLLKRRGGMRINFKWINPGDKIVLKVVHHNPTDNIRIRGSFHGISHITHLDDDYNRLAYTRRHMVCTIIISSVGTILLIFTIFGLGVVLHRVKLSKTK